MQPRKLSWTDWLELAVYLVGGVCGATAGIMLATPQFGVIGGIIGAVLGFVIGFLFFALGRHIP